MGAWADITSETDALRAKVEGHAEEMLTDREIRSFDDSKVTDDRVNAAKGVVRRKVFGADSLAREVDRYGSPEAFLDALAGSSDLKDQVVEAVAYAFLHVYASSNQVGSNDRMSEHSSRFESDVDEQIDALANIAPFSLGWSGDTGAFSGTSIKSTLDRYG